MAITVVGVNNAAAETAGTTTTAGTAAITPTLPAGTANGDRVFLYQNHSDASGSGPTQTTLVAAGWILDYIDAVVGSGTPGAGTGLRGVSCYHRDKDASWSTIPSCTLVSAVQNSHAIAVITLRKAATDTWNTPSGIGPFMDFGTAHTAFTAVSTATNLTAGTNAISMFQTVTNDNVTASAATITGSGFTSGTLTEAVDGGTATGNDVSIKLHYCQPTVTTNGALLTLAMTLSAASEGGWVGVQQTVTPSSAFTSSPNDVVGLVDSESHTQDWVRTPGDLVGILDSATTLQDFARSVTDLVGIIDSSSIDKGRNATDLVGLTDSGTFTLVSGATGPQFGSIGTALSGTGTTCLVPVPSGVASGDLILAAIFVGDTTTTVGTPGVEWSEVGSSPVSNATGQAFRLRIFQKYATGADSGTYAFTLSGSASRNAFAVRYTGGAPSSPFDFTNSASSLEFSGPPAPAPAVSGTVSAANELEVYIGVSWVSSTPTAPSGFTVRGTPITTNGTMFIADKGNPATGATGSIAGSYSATTAALGAWIGALLPPPPPSAGGTDAVGITDSSSKDLGRTLGDVVGLVDSLTRDTGRNPVDLVGVSDSIAGQQNWVRTPGDLVGITDTASFVKPDTFVTRDGATGNLILGGKRFRWSGANATLALSEDASNYGATVDAESLHLLSHSEIDAVLNSAQSMNANVIRSFATLSVGKINSVQPTLGAFNGSALEPLDYAITQCAAKGIKLILPLVDNYQYYFGGKFLYCYANGVTPDADATQFFTNTTIIASFKAHISFVLAHVNTYTGVAYKDDPTIMAWETGNELSTAAGWSYSAWTDTISRHIKLTCGAQQLVADGHYGIFTVDPTVDTTSLDLTYVDIYSNHTYDNWRTPSVLVGEGTTVHGHGKAYYVGEYTWTGSGVSPQPTWTLAQLLSAIEGSIYVDGDNFWQLLPPLTSHGDGYTLHFPGDDSNMITRSTALATHADIMTPVDLTTGSTDLVGLSDSLVKAAGRTSTDLVGVNDSATFTVDYARTPGDLVGLADSSAVQQDWARSQTDLVGASDSSAVQQDWARSQVDLVGITDSVSATTDYAKPVTDFVGLLDSATITLDYVTAQQDSVGLTDSSALTRGLAPADLVGVTDSVAAQQDWSRAVLDLVGLVDSSATQQDWTRSQTDPVGVTDSVNVTVDSARTQSDSIDVGDDVGIAQDWVRAQTDQVGLSDAATLARSTDLGDSVGSADSIAIVQNWVRSEDEQIDLTDSATFTRAGAGQLAQDELVQLGDDLDLTVDSVRAQVDSIGVTDSFGIEVGRVQIDSVGLTDSSAVQQDWARIPVDQADINDSATFTMAGADEANADDHVQIGDSTALQQDWTRSALDLAGLTDSASFTVGAVAGRNDLVGLFDSVDVTADSDRPTSDQLGISDAATFALNLTAALSDPVGIVDTATFNMILVTGEADSVDIDDDVTFLADYVRALSDPVGVADSAEFQLSQLATVDLVGITDLARFLISGPPVEDRTVVVYAENRTVDVSSEARSVNVAYEDRTAVPRR